VTLPFLSLLQWSSGNDEAAARAMGNELKGGNSYFRCAIPGLNVALQALIDYKGSSSSLSHLLMKLSVDLPRQGSECMLKFFFQLIERL
jgi:hypothetical protein